MEKSLFLKKIAEYAEFHKLIPDKSVIMVALSGGADSVALLRALLDMGKQCIAMHCNFGLRGDESERDARFVENLCHTWDVPLKTIRFDVANYIAANGVSTEMACRELRYRWFEEMRIKHQSKAIAVAHHDDDNIETFFLNLLRGSGIKGLSAIKPRNGYIIRPLLCVNRDEIEKWLSERAIRFVTDSTNIENEFKRNRFRNIIIPTIEHHFPGAKQAISHSVQLLADEYDFLRGAVERAIDHVVSESNDGWHINIPKLKSYAGYNSLLFNIMNQYGFNPTQCTEMARAIDKGCQSGKIWNAELFTAHCERQTIDIYPYAYKENDNVEFSISTDTNLPNYKIELVQHGEGFTFGNDRNTAYFDYAILGKKALLRRWREGDRFKPFNMGGSKLLSDLFNDLKLSAHEKSKVEIIEIDNEIVWVAGLRASNHFRCNLNSPKPFVRIMRLN